MCQIGNPSLRAGSKTDLIYPYLLISSREGTCLVFESHATLMAAQERKNCQTGCAILKLAMLQLKVGTGESKRGGPISGLCQKNLWRGIRNTGGAHVLSNPCLSMQNGTIHIDALDA